jgi:hypothetical protein
LSRGSDFAASVMPLLALVLMATIAGCGKLSRGTRALLMAAVFAIMVLTMALLL